MRGPTVSLTVEFTGVETTAAFMVVDPASGEQLWIPFSQCEERHGKTDSHGKISGPGTMIVTEWIAKQKGLIE